MYCSNCGAKVQDGANYCHICGHKLITTSAKTSEKTSDKTRVFDPGLLDNINHDDNLKEIVHTLDEKIAKEIYKHTNPESRDDFIGPKTKEKQVPAFKGMGEALTVDEKEDTETLIETVDEPKEESEAINVSDDKITEDTSADEKIEDTSTEELKETEEKIEAEDISEEPSENISTQSEDTSENILEEKAEEEKPSENPSPEEEIEEPETTSKRKRPFNLINSREFFEKPTDEFDLNPDTVKEEVEEEVKKLKSEIKKKDKPKEKRSFRSIWDSFISERNDEFSIFAEYTNPGIVPGEEQKKKDKKEVVDQTLTNIGSIEQTMPVPIITDEALKEAEAKKLAKDAPKETPEIKIEETKETSEKTYSTTDKESKNKKQEAKKDKPKKEAPKKEIIDDIWLRDDLKDDEELEYNDKEKAFFDEVNKKLEMEEKKKFLINKLEEAGSFPVTIILLVAALIFTLIPLLVVKFEGSVIILLLLRVAMSLIEYIAPLKTAVDKTDLPHTRGNIITAAFLAWAVGAFVTMVFFFINKQVNVVPSLLAALTPAFLGTVLVCGFAIIISYVLFGKGLRSQDRLSFLGWYGIIFVIIEVLSKVFFLAINFIMSAL